MDAEQTIKAALDGKFVRFNSYFGDFTEREVPADYIPTYEPEVKVVRPRSKCRVGYHQWTPEEDAELVSLRGTGWSKMRCGLHFSVSEGSIRSRIKYLASIRSGT